MASRSQPRPSAWDTDWPRGAAEANAEKLNDDRMLAGGVRYKPLPGTHWHSAPQRQPGNAPIFGRTGFVHAPEGERSCPSNARQESQTASPGAFWSKRATLVGAIATNPLRTLEVYAGAGGGRTPAVGATVRSGASVCPERGVHPLGASACPATVYEAAQPHRHPDSSKQRLYGASTDA